MDYNLMHKKKSKLASLMLIVFVIVNLIPVTLLESGIKTNKVYADPTGVLQSFLNQKLFSMIYSRLH